MNVVDSSGWLEYFADGPNASFFATVIEKPATLVVPTISLYEDVGEQRNAVRPQEARGIHAVETLAKLGQTVLDVTRRRDRPSVHDFGE